MIRLKSHFASLDSTSNKLYELTDEDIKQMHKTLLEIYDDLFAYCEKYSLKMIAGGGTALGIVRHKGFIPWDDDMDLDMMREDYEKFKDHFEDELGDKYDLLAPGSKEGANCFVMRVMKKGTTFLNMIDEAAPYPAGIYIDLFPIDYAPDNKLLLNLKALASDSLRFISYSVYWYKYRSESLKDFMIHSEGKTYYRFRIFIGAIFSFFSPEHWLTIFDKFIQGKKSDYITIAAGRKKYKGETFPIGVVQPVKIASFEGREMYVINNEDAYLRSLYGNYMEVPSKSSREKHLCLKLNFDNSKDTKYNTEGK